MVKEELYDRLRGPAKNMTVLATAFAEGGSERESIQSIKLNAPLDFASQGLSLIHI